MANAKGVNEIISTFPVLWEVLWLTPPDSVEQETKLDPLFWGYNLNSPSYYL